MSATIKRWFALHDGRTKFYQVFLVSSEESDRAFVVTHWGSYDVGSEHLPAYGGKCKIKEVRKTEGEWEAQRARDAKKNRGYKFESPVTEEFYAPAPLRVALNKAFKLKDAKTMSEALTGSTDVPLSETELKDASDADLDHLFGITRPAAPESVKEEKHAEWGSW